MFQSELDQLNTRITEFFKAENFEAAVKTLSEAEPQLGGTYEFHVARGDALLQLSLVQARPTIVQWGSRNLMARWSMDSTLREARKDLCRAVQLDPTQAAGHRLLGETLLYLGEDGEAETQLGLAISADPEDAASHLSLARLLVGLGRVDEASREYRRAAYLDPATATAHFVPEGRFHQVVEQGAFVRADPELSAQDLKLLERAVFWAIERTREHESTDFVRKHALALYWLSLGAAFLVVAAIVIASWDRPITWVLILLAAQLGADYFQWPLLVFSKLRYGRWNWLRVASDRSTAQELRYAITLIYAVLALPSAAFVLLVPYPGWPVGLLAAASLLPVTLTLAWVFHLVVALCVQSARRVVRPASDPVPEVVCALVQALWEVRPSAWRNSGLGPSPPREGRTAAAERLEEAATRIERDLDRSIRHRWDLAPRSLGGSLAPVRAGGLARRLVAERGRRIATWIREREAELLMSSPTLPAQVRTEGALARALVGVCLRETAVCESDNALSPTRSALQRFFPRVALAAVLGLTAWILPTQLGEEAAGLRVALMLAAASALVTPSGAWSQAVKDTQEAFGRVT